MSKKPTTYWNYIRVEELLGLQSGIAASEDELANDEVMFIVVHQIDELWFKLALRELVTVRNTLATGRVPEQALSQAVSGMRRMQLLFRKISDHFEVMETLTTRDYLAFRDKLSPASGFQSAQLREIEFLMGLSDADRIPLGHEGSYMRALRNPDGSASPASARVDKRLTDKPTLKDVLEDWLHRTPIQGSSAGDPDDAKNVAAFVESYLVAHESEVRAYLDLVRDEALTEADKTRLADRYTREIAGARAFFAAADVPEADRPRRARVRAAIAFIESYRELPLLAWPRELLDTVVSLEQAFVIFRQRHARMVERIIGRRTGTGGSAGVDYLDQTALQYRIFRDVWAVRTLLLRKSALPEVRDPARYDFVAGS
ncbi:MAG: tryptophan 2,3-dioxygenase family protein [Polyangiaceae bacterium]